MSKIVIIVDPAVKHDLLYKVMVQVVGFDEKDIVPVSLDEAILDQAVYSLKPDIVYPVGEQALNKFLNKRGIVKYAGQITRSGDIPIVPLLSPGYIERNTHLLTKYAESVYTGYQAMWGLDNIAAENQHKVITELQDIIQLVEYIKTTRYCSFDFETTELTDLATYDPDFRVTSLSISFQQGSSYVIPIDHKDIQLDKNVKSSMVEILSDEVFGNPLITKVGQNIKFDMHCARSLGIDNFEGPFHDTKTMHHLIYQVGSHKLKDMVREYYPRFANYEDEVKQYSWDNIPWNIQARYNAIDSDVTLRLYWIFTEVLLEDERLYLLFRNLSAPSTLVLFNMERRGMLVDKEYIFNSIQKVEKSIEDLEAKMYKHPKVLRFNVFLKEKAREDMIKDLEVKLTKAEETTYKSKQANENNAKRIKEYQQLIDKLTVRSGDVTVKYKPINFSSPVQLAELLYSKEGFDIDLPLDPMTGNIVRSTNKEILKLLKDKTGFVDNLLALRQLRKVLSTYLQSIYDKLDEKHYVHTTYNETGTETGRLSSRNPNLQNIISRTKYPQVKEAVSYVKNAFTVPPGYRLIQADYSQAELRLIAHVANEKNMLNAYRAGHDLHELTAASSRGYTLEEFKNISPEDYKQFRFEAKAENFGFCVTGDTKVVTDKGIFPVQEIVESTEEFNVLTHKGNWKPVINRQKFSSEVFNHKIYVITTRTGKEVKCTADHMMYVTFPSANGNPQKYGWVRAEDLEPGMYLVDNSYEGRHGNSSLGKDLSLFIGWYLSEGGCRGNSGRIAQIERNNADIWGRMRDTLGGNGWYSRIAKYPKSCEFFAIPAKIMTSVLGLYIDYKLKAKDKTFSHLLDTLSREDKLYILAGLWDGDGSIHQRPFPANKITIQYTSISASLLEDIKQCLSSLGINTTIYGYNDYMYSLNVTGSRSRKLFLDIIPTMKRHTVSYTPKKQYIAEEAISEINIVPYYDFVYDLTVKDDNSFIANGLVSHNCYGISARGFQEYARTQYDIKISLRQSEKKRDAFFDTYPNLLKYHATYIAKAKKYKYVRTFFGRKIHIPEIDSFSGVKRGHAERNAINGPIQGSAGEFTIFALVLLQHRLPETVFIVNSIHDSIFFYVPEDGDFEYNLNIIKTTMENLPITEYFDREFDKVPMKADFEESTISWGQLKELE